MPWLVGGSNELFSMGYVAGAGDVPGPNGIVEAATGEISVQYVGPRRKPRTDPVLHDPTRGEPGQPQDDGAIRLFDLPDEDPDVVPGEVPGGPGPIGGEGIRPRPRIGALAKIDHIVVLMQENRSFDQVLGYLSRDKINPAVDGLLPPDDPAHELQFNHFNGRTFPARKADRTDPARETATAWPSFSLPGPGHDTEDVLRQIDGGMGGFVANFAKRLHVTNPAETPHLRLIMDYFGPDDLPVYALLAREFGICDQWYTSHAGPTWPNRFVLLTGDLNVDQFGKVEEDNPDVKTMLPIQTPTLFDYLNAANASWRVFEHGYSFLRLFRNYTFDTTNIVPFDDPVRGFEAAAREGALPQVSLIEPDYIDLPPGNDDHPPADMRFGQDLVNRIVQALIASPAWARTLFVITYDEHGGFYDHKPPPTDVPQLRNLRATLGPRVPAFVISPLVERGAVFFGRNDATGRRFDHTSIGATILRRFGGARPPRISPRLDSALDLREVLTRAEPRPRSDFAALGLPPLIERRSGAAREAPKRREPIGAPHGRDDFHWVLSAMRLTTGEPPRVSTLLRREPQMVPGELRYYRDKTRDGTGDVGNPSVIGLGGWHQFRFLFSGGNGIIYAVVAEPSQRREPEVPFEHIGREQ
jgi:phospholipase C